jgi:hypothetical protein
MKIKLQFRLLAVLSLLLTSLPASPALAGRGADPPAGLLKADGALSLPTGFSGALDLRGWDVTLDAQRGLLIRPEGGDPSASAFSGGDWSALGTGMNNSIEAIAVSGSDVYAGGYFTRAGTCSSDDGCNHIAKWDGNTWSPLGKGTEGDVYAIAVDGSNVYAGGYFTAGTCPGDDGCSIAKWDGSTWSPLGIGTEGVVNAITVSDGAVYAGGIAVQGCPTCSGLAKWDGFGWSGLGTFKGNVWAIAVSGSDVYVGGGFDLAWAPIPPCTSGCQNIAKWNGSTWSALGTGMNSDVNAIAVSGSDVYAGGAFTCAGTCTSGDGYNYIAKWDGSTWSALGTGMNNDVNAIAVSGADMYAAGLFNSAGTCTREDGCRGIAKWDGSTWSPLGTGTGDTWAIAVSGSNVYAGGTFTSAGTCTSSDGCNYIAKYGPSSNANLNSLALSSGTLTPTFASGTTAYTADVAHSVASLTVTPTAAGAGATIQVRVNSGAWNAVNSGNPSGALSLLVGTNPIDVQVSAADGTTTKTYTVTVTRAADTTLPTVDSFTATSPSTSLNIPITAFTASDDTGVTGYNITESSTAPAAGAAGWSGTAPSTYTVSTDGTYTLYPWAKDAAGNVSAVFGSPAIVTVDTTYRIYLPLVIR